MEESPSRCVAPRPDDDDELIVRMRYVRIGPEPRGQPAVGPKGSAPKQPWQTAHQRASA